MDKFMEHLGAISFMLLVVLFAVLIKGLIIMLVWEYIIAVKFGIPAFTFFESVLIGLVIPSSYSSKR